MRPSTFHSENPPRMNVWIAHIAAATRMSLSILWAYLYFYLYVVLTYRTNFSTLILATALGIAVVVGTAHVANVFKPPMCLFLSKNKFAIARSYIIPFGVSSYSTIASKAGLITIFPRDLNVLLPSLLGAFGVFGVAMAIHLMASKFLGFENSNQKQSPPKEALSAVDIVDRTPKSLGFGIWNSFRPPMCIQWVLLIWYLWVSAYLATPSVRLYTTGLVGAVFIGLALNANVATSPLSKYVSDNLFMVIRFFLVPFGVSTYSAILHSGGHILVPGEKEITLWGLVFAIGFGVVAFLMWTYLKRSIMGPEPEVKDTVSSKFDESFRTIPTSTARTSVAGADQQKDIIAVQLNMLSDDRRV
eukprot:205079_1